MRNKYNILNALILAGSLVLTNQVQAQIVVIDPGHGYNASGGNPDGRTDTENSTALAVGLKTRTLLQAECAGWSVYLTRTTRNGWISLTQRVQMSNSWGADRFISIHCNAGGGTGTETFWCTRSNVTDARDTEFSSKVQSRMVQYGSWTNRRVVEDNGYLGYHLTVLTGNDAPGCLNEIGFVDSSDETKLLSDSWRNKFAQAYQVALSESLNKACNGNDCAASQNFTTAISSGVYKASGTITASAALANGATVVFDAGSSISLNIGFEATYDNGNAFTAQIGGCSATAAAASLSDASPEPVEILSDNGIDIYPNPSSGEVNLSFTLAESGAVNIRIFNDRGTKVDEPATQKQYDAGTHVISWNANGQQPDGTYFCAFESNGKTITKKLIIRR
jgi:N-acetylmuramoyl-L-alanine amidase